METVKALGVGKSLRRASAILIPWSFAIVDMA
jgi:hypothetical protein